MTVPTSDPAASDDAGLDDLAALADGGDAYDDAPPAPPPASGRGGRAGKSGGAAVAAGATCPGCGMAVDPNAVLCVNCGTNLKTGKKLKTTSVAGGAAGGAGAAPAFDRPFGVKSVGDEKKKSPQAQKIMAIVLAALLLGIVVTVVIVTSNARAKERERLAKLNAGPPPKLERVLTAAEKSGGLVEAMRDGTLYEEMSKHEAQKAAGRPVPKYTRDMLNAQADGIGRSGPTEEARDWLKKNADATFHGMSHDDAVKVVETLYDKYKCSWVQAVLKKEGDKTANYMIATIPDTGPEQWPFRVEFFKWQEAFGKKLGEEMPPDVVQSYAVFRFNKAADKLADADEDSEDADAAEDADDTPAKPANAKPKKPKPAAVKPNATQTPNQSNQQ
jgi:hypothetical protein